MSVFNEYARYYDLLYRDKDYYSEATYVHGLIQKHVPGASSILNLGCGSGRHDCCLTELGYNVCGVDMSAEMLMAANKAATGNSRLEYVLGDARAIRLGRQFDAVISLFHVMSYQASNADLKAAFATARAHLNPDGLFLFDCWHGPGVLSDRPIVRIRELEDEAIAVTRHAEPALRCEENVVDVNYRVIILNKTDHKTSEIRETHRMRYLFIPEIIKYLEEAGLQLIFSFKWLAETAPDEKTWYLCCGAMHGKELSCE